jgi:DNA-binding MarR family transcriptional regulator
MSKILPIMDKKSNDRINEITRIIEEGVEEYGRDEGINMEVTTIYKFKKARLPEFMMVFQYFGEYAVKNFTPATCKVLWMFVSVSEMKNYLTLDINAIEERTGMSRKSVYNAINQLKEHNVIVVVKNVQDKRRNDYFINPQTMWKGSSINREKQIAKYKENSTQLKLPNM